MIHYSLTLSLLKVFIALCLSAVHRSQAAPLASTFSWLDDLQLPKAQLFCVDRKPDPANWTYKSLYRGDIAKYYIYECKSTIALSYYFTFNRLHGYPPLRLASELSDDFPSLSDSNQKGKYAVSSRL